MSGLPGFPAGEHRAIWSDRGVTVREFCDCPHGEDHAKGARGVEAQMPVSGLPGPLGAPSAPDAPTGEGAAETLTEAPSRAVRVQVGDRIRAHGDKISHIVRAIEDGCALAECDVDEAWLADLTAPAAPMVTGPGAEVCLDCREAVDPAPPVRAGLAAMHVDAALRRAASVRLAETALLAATVPDRALVLLRVEHPDATLAELAAIAGQPVASFGPRLRRAIAAGVRAVAS